MDNRVPSIQEIDDANVSTVTITKNDNTKETVPAIVKPVYKPMIKPVKKPETIVNKINTMIKPKKYAKKRYYQINLMNGAGDKTLIKEIAKKLKDKYEVNINSFVISIKEKQGKVIGDK